MAKFSGTTKVKKAESPLRTKGKAARTHEGHVGVEMKVKTELFLRAVVNMVGEDKFYESGVQSDKKFVELIHKVAKKDPQWIASFIPYLRGYEKDGEIIGMNMRSASTQMAAEYVAATVGMNVRPRAVVASALQRADEPAEIIGYWWSRYGKTLPQPLKRGIADAVNRLYTQKAALKYDGQSRDIRMADVIELVRPTPKDDTQSALFRYLIEKRHNRETLHTEGLDLVRSHLELEAVPVSERRKLLETNTEIFERAGVNWEWVSGWIQGKMDATVWERTIPQMGYMALLRNLRNFEDANVNRTVLEEVAKKLADPNQVKMSRQFPYRFWSAYSASESLFFGQALEDALNLTCKNIPSFGGRTLILQDTSASMGARMSQKSKITNTEAGAIFGAALALRGENVDWYLYAQGWEKFQPKKSILKTMDDVNHAIGRVGHATNTFQTLKATYNNHDRIFIISDMQAHPGDASFVERIQAPIYTFALGGYTTSHYDTDNQYGRYLLGGLTDDTFKMVRMLEEYKTGQWPWEIES